METKIVRNPVKIKQQLGMFGAEVSALRLFQGYFWNECCVTNLTVTSTVYQPRARPQPQRGEAVRFLQLFSSIASFI